MGRNKENARMILEVAKNMAENLAENLQALLEDYPVLMSILNEWPSVNQKHNAWVLVSTAFGTATAMTLFRADRPKEMGFLFAPAIVKEFNAWSRQKGFDPPSAQYLFGDCLKYYKSGDAREDEKVGECFYNKCKHSGTFSATTTRQREECALFSVQFITAIIQQMRDAHLLTH